MTLKLLFFTRVALQYPNRTEQQSGKKVNEVGTDEKNYRQTALFRTVP